MMKYKEALSYLNSFIDYESILSYNYGHSYSLENLNNLLSYLHEPQNNYLSIIITGTKGKGTIANILNSVISKSGVRTGLFTSPHLLCVRERIQFGNVLISKKEFSKYISLIKRVIIGKDVKRLTYFEVLAAAAFLFFSEKRVEIAILEVGLGGRLDAVNVVSNAVSVITPISYDHTHLLGKSLRKIAKEKCGIIKDNSFVITGPQKKEAFYVIERTVREKNAKLFCVSSDKEAERAEITLKGSIFKIKHNKLWLKLFLPLIGRHYIQNAITALKVLDVLNSSFKINIKTDSIKKGFSSVSIPGRFQIIEDCPMVVLDGAHNFLSALALRKTVEEVFKNKERALILGVSLDKDIEKIGRVLCPIANKVFFTKSSSSRAAEPEILANRLKGFCKEYYVCDAPKDALLFAKNMIGFDGVIIVTGSFYLVADVMRYEDI